MSLNPEGDGADLSPARLRSCDEEEAWLGWNHSTAHYSPTVHRDTDPLSLSAPSRAQSSLSLVSDEQRAESQ
ncbi:hypothetical protein KUCAC02_009926 [Chaenocephalus aceratus]|uniref:Uncharacterized protein n=1 Tax=Chaenocephalus aceratus TaxID=36190 RepID=A0ACB9VXQ5_CHAAC|nr:hypothetical protein KUCAC02_009926 [Chaenocephalus aceratus]